MDTGNGNFVQVDAKDEEELKRKMFEEEAKWPEHGGWFREGEILEIRGSRFRVKSVRPMELRLKLLARKES